MHPFTLIMTVVLGFLLTACSGGGSSSGGDAGPGNEAERNRVFRDRAVELAHDVSQASCTEVTCARPEHASQWYDAINDLERGACEYRCMPVEIDDSGEMRTYLVTVVFVRFPNGCFEPQGEIELTVEVFELCHPSF